MKNIKVGVIGCGFIATTRHLPAWRHLKNAEIISVADIDIERSKKVAQVFKVNKFTDDYHDVLNEKPDMVDICTPIAYHAEHVIEAIKSGCHVLVEKPMTLSIKEAEEIANVAKEYKVKVCVCHSHRYIPGVRDAKRLIDEGQLGKITLCRVAHHSEKPKGWRLDPKHGGLLGEEVCHDIDLQLWLLGKVKSLHALSWPNGSNGFNADEVCVLLRSITGAVGIIDVSWMAKRYKWSMEVYGTEGELSVNLHSGIMTDPTKSLSNIRYFMNFARRALSYMVFRERVTCHYYLINDFLKSVLNNTMPPVPVEEEVMNIRVMEAINETLSELTSE